MVQRCMAVHTRALRACAGHGAGDDDDNDAPIHAVQLQPVLYQYDKSDPLNPRGLIIAYT